MKRVMVLLFFIIIFSLLFFSCIKKGEVKKDKILVVTTLFPIYDFTKAIGQEAVEVTMLLPPGVEAHHYEPTPADMAKIEKADIFIYTSSKMEVWVDKIISSISDKKKVLEAATDVNFIRHSEEENDTNEKDDEHDNHHGVDPHIWLDFYNSKKIASNILNALIDFDQSKKEYFTKNFELLALELDKLDKEYEEVLSKCRIKTIIYAGHFAFGYLAHRYGLKHISPYNGFSSESEPTVDNIVSLIESIKEIGSKYIFYEKLINNKIKDTLSKEAKVGLLELNPAHNITKDEVRNNVTFFDIMYKNLENLKVGLEYSK